MSSYPNGGMRANLLVTMGARAAYMDTAGHIDLPGGSYEEDQLANFVAAKVDEYMQRTDAVDICKTYGLYSPVYGFSERNGCFFCPNAGMRELRHLYDHHPELWKRLLELQKAPNKATELFNRTDTIDEIDGLFQFEDAHFSLFDKDWGNAAA